MAAFNHETEGAAALGPAESVGHAISARWLRRHRMMWRGAGPGRRCITPKRQQFQTRVLRYPLAEIIMEPAHIHRRGSLPSSMIRAAECCLEGWTECP